MRPHPTLTHKTYTSREGGRDETNARRARTGLAIAFSLSPRAIPYVLHPWVPVTTEIYVRTDCNLHVALPLYSNNRRCPPWATAVLKLSDMPLGRHMLVAAGHSRVTAVLKGLLLNIATLRRPHTSPRSSSRYAATSVNRGAAGGR